MKYIIVKRRLFESRKHFLARSYVKVNELNASILPKGSPMLFFPAGWDDAACRRYRIADRRAQYKEKAEELEMIREKFKDYSGRRCSVFYCDKARDRICCCDCPLLDECPTRNGPCLNDPEHCICVDRSERKTKT